MKSNAARASIAAIAVLTGFAAGSAQAAYKDDVGYTALQAELGPATPNGAGVLVTQVEAAVMVSEQWTWMPDPAEFLGKIITDETGAPDSLYSSHATGVAHSFFGNPTSTSPGIDTISAYHADVWMGSDFLWATQSKILPASSTSRIANHSWIADVDSANADVLKRLDWVIETDDMLHVAALNNGGGASSFPLLASAFNVIAIGRSDGAHQTGSVAIDTTYAAGRTRPDLVVPAGSTSAAAPRLSSLTALLVQTGNADTSLSTDPGGTSFTNRAGVLIRNAERVEVIKAALMAGADRVTRNSTSTNLALYRGSAANRAANGLDTRYGAGQVNIRNSYRIIAAGEQNSTEDGGAASGTANRGFDYDGAFGGGPNTNNSVGTYPLPVSATPQLLTASLVWNLDIYAGLGSGPNRDDFIFTPYFHHLELSVVDVANPTVKIVTSQSAADNTQNLWMVIPANAQYALRAARVGEIFKHDYAVAWQLLTDSDADGAHDGQDNCINASNGPLVADAGGNSQRDTDGDGYGNICDGDMDNGGGLINFADLGSFRAAFGTSNANADLDGSNGIVNFADLALFRAMSGKTAGPSAYGP
jgi:hypothetical protein